MDPEEAAAIEELKAMSDEELLLVDHDIVKWVCQGKGCCNGTKIRDYGIAPVYYKKHRSFKDSFFDINRYYWMCSKHFKMFKRLSKNYPVEKVEYKIFDFTKPKICRTNIQKPQ